MIARSRSSSLLSERTVSFKRTAARPASSREARGQARSGAATGRRWCRPGRGRSRRAASRPASGGRRSRRRTVPAEELADPVDERALEPLDLCLAAGDDLAGVGVALDLGVEVVDQRGQVRLQQRGGGRDPLRVVVGPADVGLELPVAVEELVRVHDRPRSRDREMKKAHASPSGEAWAYKTRPARPFASDPVNHSYSLSGRRAEEKRPVMIPRGLVVRQWWNSNSTDREIWD